MKLRTASYWLLCSFLVSLPLVALLWQTHARRDTRLVTTPAQCIPGPVSDEAINRCYDDGYVYVDVSGNVGGYTTHWSYQSSSQIQNGLIFFHSRTNLDAYTVQVVTDAYDVGSIVPPLAPYSGSFQGPGICLRDAPYSRSTNVMTLPLLAIQNAAANRAFVSQAPRTRLDQDRQDYLAKR
jgi:hypothetical protein